MTWVECWSDATRKWVMSLFHFQDIQWAFCRSKDDWWALHPMVAEFLSSNLDFSIWHENVFVWLFGTNFSYQPGIIVSDGYWTGCGRDAKWRWNPKRQFSQAVLYKRIPYFQETVVGEIWMYIYIYIFNYIYIYQHRFLFTRSHIISGPNPRLKNRRTLPDPPSSCLFSKFCLLECTNKYLHCIPRG